MWTAGGGRRKCSFSITFGLGVLMLPQLLTAAPSQPVTSGRAVQALQSFCQTFSGWNTMCGPLRRAKRSSVDVPWSDLLIQGTTQMPDTKWCGAGNTSTSYEDLGHAKATDRCCRDHDYCPLFLVPGESRGGATNTGSFTRSACGCDTAFFHCLVEVNTEHSQLVGELYFNILEPDCIKNVTSCSRRGRPGRRRQQQQQLKLVKSPLSGQYPDPPNEEHMLDKAEDLAVRAWSELVKIGQSDSDH